MMFMSRAFANAATATARFERLYADRDVGRAADPRDHVRAGIQHLSLRAHRRRARARIAERTREIEFGLRIMAQDFSQAVPRPIRDPLGSTRAPSLRAGLGKATLVDLTRAGWSNTAGMQRSTLQRVSYQLTGDKFQRSYQTVLDPTQNNTPVVQDLLTGVKGDLELSRRQSELVQPMAAGHAANAGESMDAARRSRDRHRVQGLGPRASPRRDRGMRPPHTSHATSSAALR
jgi:type II secretory pathway component PulJ